MNISPGKEHEELAAREQREKRVKLRTVADVLVDLVHVGRAAVVVDFDVAPAGGDVARDHFEGGCFAGAVDAYEAEALASVNAEGEGVDGHVLLELEGELEFVVDFGQVDKLDEVLIVVVAVVVAFHGWVIT